MRLGLFLVESVCFVVPTTGGSMSKFMLAHFLSCLFYLHKFIVFYIFY